MSSPRRPSDDNLPDRAHPHRLPPEAYRIPCQPMHASLDAKRGQHLWEGRRPAVLIETMGRVGRRQRVHIHAYAIMPDHLHVVLSVIEEGGDMAKWLAYFKRETARKLQAPGMWQRSFWDRHATNGDHLTTMVEYILANPIHARIVGGWSESPYTWSEWHPETKGRDPNLRERAG